MLLVLAVLAARALRDGEFRAVARQTFFTSLVFGLKSLVAAVGPRTGLARAAPTRHESRASTWILDLLQGLHMAAVMLMLAFTPASWRSAPTSLRVALGALGLQFWPMAAWNLCFSILTLCLLVERPLAHLWSEVAISMVSVLAACAANYLQEMEGYKMLAASWTQTLTETSDFVFTLRSDLCIAHEVPQLSKLLAHDVSDVSLQGVSFEELVAPDKDHAQLTDFLTRPVNHNQSVKALRLSMRSELGAALPMLLLSVRLTCVDGTERHICGLCLAGIPKAAKTTDCQGCEAMPTLEKRKKTSSSVSPAKKTRSGERKRRTCNSMAWKGTPSSAVRCTFD